MASSRRSTIFISAVVTGLLMAGCAGTPHLNPVQKTQRAYQKAEKDSVVVRNAPDKLEDAQKAMNKLKHFSGNNGNQTAFKQQLALARQRIAIARKTAELRAAKNTVQRLSDELHKLQTKVHKIKKNRLQERLANMKINKRVKYLKYFNARQTSRGIVLSFKKITFYSGKSYLTSKAEPPIDELADLLDQYPDRNIRIEGYTDNSGPKSLNRKLSQQRADAVRKAIISRKIAPARVRAVGFGEQYPIASNKTKKGRQENRRVDIVISDKKGNIPDRRQ
ncbi:MAG TPA: OmpA family protein [Balneolaceae bacterium]|nr:OmpA family protein [Balneolaceae bacterium]